MTGNSNKKEPIPYTAGDYDPGHTGRPAADAPTDASRPAGQSHGAGAGSQKGSQPTPYNKNSENN